MDASVFEYREVYYRLQLQGLLNDICGVYALICQSEQHLPDDENKIRDAFGKYFFDQAYKMTTTTAKDYHYGSEVWLQLTAGRIDMQFLSPNCYKHQDAFFAIECKRLDGRSHLSKEYVDNGIRRFTKGKYPSLLGCNAMLGFVVCTIDLPATMSQINSHLEQTEYLVTTNSTMSTRVDLESRHGTPYDFVLYHVWLDFSGLVI